MATVKELLKVLDKSLEANVVVKSNTIEPSERLKTGIFNLDLIMGGGFPKGKLSIVYGVESSNKTNTVYLALANSQKDYPSEVCVFVDLEGGFDATWAGKMGVDTEKLILVQPNYAEEAIDIIDAFMQTDDIGLIAVDSLAAMMTLNEGESSAEKVAVGGAAGIIGKFIRKATTNLRAARREGRNPTLICITQTRMKIGVLYGNPETFSGGNAPKFASSMTLRFYGKDIIDRNVHPERPCKKETTVSIKKFKVPTAGNACKFELVVIPHNGLAIGECNDRTTITAYLKDFGWLAKTPDGKNWEMFGEVYRTQKEGLEQVFSDRANLNKVKQAIFDKVLTTMDGDNDE